MAARAADKLRHKDLLAAIARLRAAKQTAAFSDGAGLSLVLTPAGRARWVHKFRHQGRNCERWLPGDFPDGLGLADAREIRDADRKLLREGKNPISAAKAAAEAAKGIPTFAEYAKANAAFLAPKRAANARVWLRQMTGEDTEGVSVGALATMLIDEISMEDVKAIIAPLWFSKPATAKELCGRIRRVLEHRQVNARPDDERRNPADFARISKAIGKRFELIHTPRAALPYEQVPAFLAKLAGRPQLSARALEMIVATGTRCWEITHARWCEVDWRARTLTIPAERMKAEHDEKGQPHVIPLSLSMVRILRRAMPPHGYQPGDLIFPNSKGRPYHSKDVLAVVNAVAGAGPTTHGFRSALTDWGTSIPHRAHAPFGNDLMDKVIAHKVGNKVSQTYQRDRWLSRRRVVMREWSRYCAGPASAVVLPFRRAA